MARAIASVVAAAGLAFLGGLILGRRGEAVAVDPGLDARLARMERDLAALHEVLSGTGARPGHAGPELEQPTVPRQAGAPAPQPLDTAAAGDADGARVADGAGLAEAQVERLLAELRAMEFRLRSELHGVAGTEDDVERTAALVERMRGTDAEVDWYAWDPILALWDADREAARAELKLMTAEEVIDRFGPPTDVWSNTNGITWQYARGYDALAEKYQDEIILRMPDGYVTQLAVRGLAH